ncbi:MAG: ABC transporter substrate-binding protein [Marinobacter sp.]
MMRRFSRNCATLLALVLLAGCLEPSVQEQRQALAEDDSQPINIGIAWPEDHPKNTLRNGLAMALDDINDRGGVLGRPLKLMHRDDKGSVDEGMVIAQSFADNPNVMAVIGHLNTYVATAAAPTYQYNGLLMLAPGAEGSELTSPANDLIFRTTPENNRSARQIVERMLEQGHERVMVYYPDNNYGLDLANWFEFHANEQGLRVMDRRSHTTRTGEYRQVLTEWRDFYQFDAIFIASTLPDGADIIRVARETGITQPIVAGAGLDSPRLPGADPSLEGVLVASTFHPDLDAAGVDDFVARYKARFDEQPDTAAAKGYDTLRLLARAMENAGTPAPEAVADALNAMEKWQGVTGFHQFDEQGDLVKQDLLFKVVRNGTFQLPRDHE